MRNPVRYVGRGTIALGAVALMVAACGGDDGSDPSPGGSTGGFVSVASVDGTDVLVDSDGSTLYTTPAEQDGQIYCVDACTAFWEPVVATSQQAKTAATELDADLAVVKRPDGDTQLTYAGLPLYTFTEEDPGQLEGDGFVDDFQGTHFEWEAARTDGTSSPATPDDNDDGGFDY
jgi:predicted lipoprotein with Yx(FWY)xxD motif